MLKILQADGGQLPLDFDKYFIQEETNGEDQIGFTLPLDHADYKLLAEEVQLLDAEDGQVYRITAIDEGAATANIKGKLELSPLRADMRIPYTNGSDTLASTVEGVLPAGWTVVDHSLSTIRRTIDLDSATPEDVILGAASAFGGLAIRYKIADKAVHFYAPGDFKAGGVYLTEELNLTSTNFKGSSSGLCTRLYARGKDGLTFAGINGGKDYVENFSYTDKIICAYWEDERYTVAENLLEAAQKRWTHLRCLCAATAAASWILQRHGAMRRGPAPTFTHTSTSSCLRSPRSLIHAAAHASTIRSCSTSGILIIRTSMS